MQRHKDYGYFVIGISGRLLSSNFPTFAPEISNEIKYETIQN